MTNTHPHNHKVFPLVLFSIAMGLLEAVVVVYLRQLYYPNGFTFPLSLMEPDIYRTELLREAATLVMLACVSAVAGRKYYERLAYFLMTFAVWDIFYYVFLKVLLDWPLTLLDWDILFLIPISWIGPVLAPLLCSLAMLLMAGLILHFDRTEELIPFSGYEWTCVWGGAGIIFLTFIRDYARLILASGLLRPSVVPQASEIFQNMAAQFVPQHFAWGWFALGLTVILMGVFSWTRRSLKHPKLP